MLELEPDPSGYQTVHREQGLLVHQYEAEPALVSIFDLGDHLVAEGQDDSNWEVRLKQNQRVLQFKDQQKGMG